MYPPARHKHVLFYISVYGLFSLIRKKLVDIFLNLLVAVTNIYIMAMAMTFFFRQFDYSRVVHVYSAVFSFVLLAIWQYICHQWEWKYFPKQTAVLFAAGEEAARIQKKLAKTYGLEQALQSVCDSCQQANWKQLIDANYYVFIGAELPIADKEKILRYARSTLNSCGSSSSLVARISLPNFLILGSPSEACTGPHFASASCFMLRNLCTKNVLPYSPTRSCE